MVERVVVVWVQEEILQAIDDGADAEDGFPVFPQNVQADVTLQVDVRVVDLEDCRHTMSGRDFTHLILDQIPGFNF